MPKKTCTSLYPRFCLSVNHSTGYLDENAIKAVLEAGQRAMANEMLCLNCVVDGEVDSPPDSVAVQVVGLDIGRKPVNLRTFGTSDIPLKMHCQTKYIP